MSGEADPSVFIQHGDGTFVQWFPGDETYPVEEKLRVLLGEPDLAGG